MKNTISKNLVWYSTPESFLESKVSVIAICETCCIAYFFWHRPLWNGSFHITLALFILPLLLLRTDESTKYGLAQGEKIKKKIIYLDNLPKSNRASFILSSLKELFMPWIFLGCILTVLGLMGFIVTIQGEKDFDAVLYLIYFTIFIGILDGLYHGFGLFKDTLIVRIHATLRCLFLNPKNTLINIPKNAWSQTICLDFFYPPELLPGTIISENKKKIISPLQPYGFFCASLVNPTTESTDKDKTKLQIFCKNIVSALVSFITAYSYRCSIKGLSIILIPLGWLIKDTVETGTKPEHIVNSDFHRYLRRAVFTISVCIGFNIYNIVSPIPLSVFDFKDFKPATEDKLRDILDAFFPKDEVLIWHMLVILLTGLVCICKVYAKRLALRGYSESQLYILYYIIWAVGFNLTALIISLIYWVKF